MKSRIGSIAVTFLLSMLGMFLCPAAAQQHDTNIFSEMRWRSIGPYRGGRTKAVAGVPSRPNVFYIGVCNGGVWKTTDYGRTWKPIFDSQPTGSIGAIAVAPSNPDILYVGSGEGLQRPDLSTGDGIYKSIDAGRTWSHLGLRDGQQIPQIIVDPRNPDRLFVAVLGHPYGPNEERGIFRSIDGGKNFQKVLYKDDNTGGSDLEFDPVNPDVVYAALWEARQGPWENGAWSGTGGGIYKSSDGGATWRQLSNGLPSEGVVQADLAVAKSDPSRLYASVASVGSVGIYRSDDAGETWYRATTDARPAARIGGGDLPVLAVDPKNADIVYSATVVTWKSSDGGKSWIGIRGAPGGDDYQKIWINPDNPDILLISSDQGAIITVNGGESWSSWYNQPTAQLYHVAADNAYPYRVCSGQQESGSACVASRGNDGQVTFREWHPAGLDEYGYAAPDPADPDVVFGGRSVTRFDRRTGQVQNVGPKPGRAADFRTLRTAPVLFSPTDNRILFFAGNTLWKTANGGQNWQQISPDLSRKTWEVPATIGKYRGAESARPTQRGVIYTVAPSYIDVNRIWAGTDDGLIHFTTDGGGNWKDVTPPQLGPWAKVSLIDAGHFDVETAYAAINTLRLDDMRPHLYRTHDGGKSWTHITNGIPDGAPINAVREDPIRKGLLFAGTEREVYVSFDDGDRWQSLRLNMPATSMRDLIVKDDDLVVATHGRGFWILDDITPLRQVDLQTVEAASVLFHPRDAIRVRWNMNTDTPLPPDEPAGQNPPDGAIIDYYLRSAATNPVLLEVFDGSGNLVRRYSSSDKVELPDSTAAAVPLYWYRPSQVLSAAPGMHRFLWDMHYQPAAGAGGRSGLPMTAIVHDTPAAHSSPWVIPGMYTLKLTVDGRTHAQSITVKMDPRVKITPSGLAEQFALSKQMYDGILGAQAALQELRALRTSAKIRRERAGEGAAAQALSAFDQKASQLEGVPGGRFGGGGQNTLAGIIGSLSSLMGLLQSADTAPTSPLSAAVAESRQALASLISRWNALKNQDLAALNARLKQADLPPLTIN